MLSDTQTASESRETAQHSEGPPEIDAQLLIQGVEPAEIQTLIVDGQEALGRLFSFTIHVAAGKALREGQIVGSKAQLVINADGVVRTLHGMISECAYDGSGHENFYYVLTFSPEYWRLTQRVNCRIFHDLPTPEIAERVFRDHGLIRPAFKPVLREKYGPRNYCVQYGESDWDFVSRLFEEEGIYHLFREDEERALSVLTITDGPHGQLDCPYGLDARYHQTEGLDHEPASIHEFRFRRVIRAGRVSQTDYAASKPSLPLTTAAVASE